MVKLAKHILWVGCGFYPFCYLAKGNLHMLKIKSINQKEAFRYLGYKSAVPDEKMQQLMNACENEVLGILNVKYLFKEFDITVNDNKVIVKGTSVAFSGKAIVEHLSKCKKAIVLCATISAGVDKLLRKAQILDMTRAVVIDSLANAAVEQVAEMLETLIAKKYNNYYLTWRFSPGYGDFPIESQKEILGLLNAQKRIGLCTDESSLLMPTKSITAVIGLSEEFIDKGRSSCSICNMNKTCKFRKEGKHCV